MGKGQAPKPPSPTKTAAAQTASNIGTAIAEGKFNQVNQVGPDGTLTYSQSGTYDYVDPLTGKVHKIPLTTATTQLSEAQQKIKNETDAAQFNLAGAANVMSGQLGTAPFKSNEEVEARLFDLGNKRLAPRLAQEEEALRTRLANQGIKLGSTAFDRAMEGEGQKANDAYNQLALTGRSQAYNESVNDYNMPLNRITALLSGSQVNSPTTGFANTPQSNVANTDYAGLVNSNYQNQLAAYQQKQAGTQAMLGGMFGLAGKAIPFL